MLKGKDLLQQRFILADGAMGTWFSQQTGQPSSECELANLQQPSVIKATHQAYVKAGARLLRTNTFAAAYHDDPLNPQQLINIIRQAYALACSCADDNTWVAADIGPGYGLDPERASEATRHIIETFIAEKASLYLFETFADPDELLPLCRLIKARLPDAVIMASFAFSADGITDKGKSLSQVSQTMELSDDIDVWGFNCGLGPTHVREQLSQLPATGKPLTLMPNSGYPRLENERLVYGSSPAYFAEALRELKSDRVLILGGCCGTTPQHIKAAADILDKSSSRPPAMKQAASGLFGSRLPDTSTNEPRRFPAKQSQPAGSPTPARPETDKRAKLLSIRLADKLFDTSENKRFTLVCELDPPRDSHLQPLLEAAKQLQLQGLDALTIADSPLARVKLDPIICASRLSRETGMPVIPHLCCRDRNANALRSSLLAAHSEGLRQVLAITGDAIPEADRGFVKPVFNLSSFGLLELISHMNQDVFADDPFLAAAALDPGAPNQEAEYKRLLKKKEQGAALFLTQPVYDMSALSLIEKARQAGASVLIGLMPLVSYRNALFLSQEVPGIRIPEPMIHQFKPDQSREEARKVGIEQTISLAGKLYQEADGFYLIAPFNRADIITEIIAALQELGIHQPLC